MNLTKYEIMIILNLIENELDKCYRLEQCHKNENYKHSKENAEYYRKKYMEYLTMYQKILNMYNVGED